MRWWDSEKVDWSGTLYSAAAHLFRASPSARLTSVPRPPQPLASTMSSQPSSSQLPTKRFKPRSLSLSSTGRGRRRDSIDVIDPNVALDLATHQTYSENVFLFVPNLIGYGRIILAALALNYMKSHPMTCTLLYGLSCLLDAFDGMAARALGQTSKFGAVLDMVTDRCVHVGVNRSVLNGIS